VINSVSKGVVYNRKKLCQRSERTTRRHWIIEGLVERVNGKFTS